MTNEYTTIKFLAKTIRPETTQHGLDCPFCRGGRHGEKALTITRRRDGTALFICHRASCSRAGRVFVDGHVSINLEDPRFREFTPRPYDKASRALSDEERELIARSYSLTYHETNYYRLSIDQESGRLVIPVMGPQEQFRGHILSNLPGATTKPKSLIYKILDEPFAAWFWPTTAKREKIVVVEDCISAMRVGRQYVAVALMGTNLNIENMLEILKYSDNMVLALDKDATQKALHYQHKYKFMCPAMQVAMLEKDLKWLSDAEITERVSI